MGLVGIEKISNVGLQVCELSHKLSRFMYIELYNNTLRQQISGNSKTNLTSKDVDFISQQDFLLIILIFFIF